MKRMFVVVAVVMALTLAFGVASVGAQAPMGGGYGGGMGYPMGGGFWNPFYHVRYGDTLSEIGLKVGVPYWQIAQANGIWNPNIIFAGQKLLIPQRPGPQPFPMGYGQQWPGYGGFGGGFGGGYASWSSGGYSSWGGYPYGGGGYYPMPYGGGYGWWRHDALQRWRW